MEPAEMKDVEYIEKYYTVKFDSAQAVQSLGNSDQSERYQKDKDGFQPYVLSTLLSAAKRASEAEKVGCT